MTLLLLFMMLMEMTPCHFLETTDYQFMDLPAECRKDFQYIRLTDETFEYIHLDKSEAKKNQVTICAVYYDMNGDGIDELFMLKGTGQYGTGGLTFLVYTKSNKNHTYKHVGDVFGTLIRVDNGGILVYSPCGAFEANCLFYRLIDDKLKEEYHINVNYAKPIRNEPKQITLFLLPGIRFSFKKTCH